jgi:DNA-binding MarR family transcriptional regulator
MVHMERMISRAIDAAPERAVASQGLGSGDAAPVDAIMGQIRTALGELRCVGSERLAKRGVSMTTMHLLSMLQHHGTLSMSRLADLLDVSLSNATGLVDRMEERGLVERVRDDEDRRLVLVRCSGGGTELLSDTQLLKDEWLRKVLLSLEPGQLRCVQDALQYVRAAVSAVGTDPDTASNWHAHTTN